MRCIGLTVVLTTLLLSGCATPYHSAESYESTAMITYTLDTSHEHYFSESSGEVVANDDNITGPVFSSRQGRRGATVVYLYQSESCTTAPRIMGNIKNNNQMLSKKVRAGVPLVNSYRTKYQTCRRDCYKHFYTSSIFTPEENGRYEAVVEPIDGVTIYKIVNGKRVQETDNYAATGNCKY